MLKNQRRNKRAQADNIMENLKQRGLEVKRVGVRKIRKKQRKGSQAGSERLSLYSDHSLPFINKEGKAKRVEFIINQLTEKTDEHSDLYSTEEMKISEVFQISLSKVMRKIRQVYGKEHCIQGFDFGSQFYQHESDEDNESLAPKVPTIDQGRKISDGVELIGEVKGTPEQV